MKNTRTASHVEVEILKFPTGLHAIKSIALDGNDFPALVTNLLQRNVVPAGTILKQSATNTDKHTEYRGTGTITGILGRDVDILAAVSEGIEPASPMFYHECVFATQAIVGFTLYASALVSTLNTCKFE
jgi:hypothetical protein